jgi:hypothetical protein
LRRFHVLKIAFVATDCKEKDCLTARKFALRLFGMSNAPEQIKAWAAQEGRKLSWLAEQVPVGPSDLSRWLNRKATPRRIYRARLADITGLQVADERAWQ